MKATTLIPTSPKRLCAPLLVLSLMGGVMPAVVMGQTMHAESPDAVLSPAQRWQSSLNAFDAEDQRRAHAKGGVVFVGSSSIRMWNDLETSFKSRPVVIKRGFGGSRLLDCVALAHQLVLRYRPEVVVVYAGENDLAEGASPQQVLDRFIGFVRTVKQDLPDSRIVFVSIKPSPYRSSLIPMVREANALVRAYSLTEPQLDYIDVFSAMLDDEGNPRGELFLPDRLHLNADGYALWKAVISTRL